jgi:hypothetical protein
MRIRNTLGAFSYFNRSWILLLVFAASFVFNILFHTFRRWRLLTFSKCAPTLAWLFVVKALLLTLDIVTQALLLYSVLKRFGDLLFKNNEAAIPIMLTILIVSPIVTLSTNSLINIPLHYFFLKLKLTKNKVNKDVSIFRTLKSAFFQSFHHWLVVCCGVLALFIFVCTFWLIQVIYDPSTEFTTTNAVSFFQYGSEKRLVLLVQLNVACNYGVGVVTAVVFWIYTLVTAVVFSLFNKRSNCYFDSF